jgi:hypothetical protein
VVATAERGVLHVPAEPSARAFVFPANAPSDGSTAPTPSALERRSNSRRLSAGRFEPDESDIWSPSSTAY